MAALRDRIGARDDAEETPPRRPKAREPVAPTAEMICARAKELEDHYRIQDDQIRRMRTWRDLSAPITLPKRLSRIEVELDDPTIMDEMARIIAALTLFSPRVTVTAPDPNSEGAQLFTTTQEHWIEQVLLECGARKMGPPAHERATDACVADGAGWVRMTLDEHIWDTVWETPEYREHEEPYDTATGGSLTKATPVSRLGKRKVKVERPALEYLDDRENRKKGAGPPFRIEQVDTICVRPVFRGGELVEMLEATERPSLEVLRDYDKIRERDESYDAIYGMGISEEEARQYPEKCTFYAHWTPHYVTYVMESGPYKEQLVQIKHGYGFVPYYWAPGIFFNQWDNRKVGWSIGQSKLRLCELRAKLWLLVVNIAAQTAGTPIKHTTQQLAEGLEGDTQEPQGEIEMWELNGVYHLEPGEDFAPMLMPGVPDAVRELIQILNQAIANLDSPRLNANIDSIEGGAGFGIAQVLTEARVRHAVYANHLQQMWVHLIKDMRKLAKKFAEAHGPIYVHYTPNNPKANQAAAEWLAAGPEDLDDTVGIQVKINAEPPTAELVKSRYAHERKREGTWGNDQAIESMGDNPDEVRRAIYADKMRAEGFSWDYIKSRTMENLRVGDLLRQQAAQMAQTGLGPGLPNPQAMGFGAPIMPPGGQGGAGIPDPGALAMSPQGQGAAPSNGAVFGAGPGAVVPALANNAQSMGLGGS